MKRIFIIYLYFFLNTAQLFQNWNSSRVSCLIHATVAATATAATTEQYFLGLLVSIGNDRDSILEFIQHYFEEGVDHFFIYNHNSTDNSIRRIKECFPPKYFSFYSMKDIYKEDSPSLSTQRNQQNHYNRIYQSLPIKKRVKWLVRVDTDEFITSRAFPHLSLKDFLMHHENQTHTLITPACAAYSVPWLIFSWGKQKSAPKNKVRSSLIYRWGYDQKYSVVNRRNASIKMFHDRHEGVENVAIFKPSEVTNSWAPGNVQFIRSHVGGKVCIPHTGLRPRCADRVLKAAGGDKASRTAFRTFTAKVQNPNIPSNGGFYRDSNGITHGLPRWCPFSVNFTSVATPLYTYIMEADVPQLQLAVFHYPIRSDEQWKLQYEQDSLIELDRDKMRQVNRLDVEDDFMIRVRKPARQRHPDFIKAQKIMKTCPSNYFSDGEVNS